MATGTKARPAAASGDSAIRKIDSRSPRGPGKADDLCCIQRGMICAAEHPNLLRKDQGTVPSANLALFWGWLSGLSDKLTCTPPSSRSTLFASGLETGQDFASNDAPFSTSALHFNYCGSPFCSCSGFRCFTLHPGRLSSDKLLSLVRSAGTLTNHDFNLHDYSLFPATH